MQIVISGTHSSGKSTLISDFAMHYSGFEQLADPFEVLNEDWNQPGVSMFTAQLRIAAARLRPDFTSGPGPDRIAERGPIDFLAYLIALEALGGLPLNDDLFHSARSATIEAMQHVDLLVVLPLTAGDPLDPGDDEHPALRTAMNNALLDLVDDAELIGEHTIVAEIFGGPDQRRSALESLVTEWRENQA